ICTQIACKAIRRALCGVAAKLLSAKSEDLYINGKYRACQGNTAQRLCDRCVVKFFLQNLLTRENGYGILNVLHERYNT
ncbi:hypothetical protein, partial [uncultured Ruminococcus sp.]|uniref:hypothetical protein n=1 Tax=uncultured Ruminococcus sp. TaxID=165186 RepID=UPI002665E325